MTSASEKDGERRRSTTVSSAANGQQPQTPKTKKKRPEGTELGSALRSAYQRTVDEAIPSDLLDLLGKLG